MRKLSSIFKILILILISIFCFSIANAESIKKINFETIIQGVSFKYEQNNRQHIIEIYNLKDWQMFWSQHVKGTFPSPSLPKVNFENYLIIVAIDEIRAGGGYTLEIKEITIYRGIENRPFEITIQLKQPGSAMVTTSALTRPYHIVKIKKYNM